MAAAAQRLVRRWDGLADRALVDVAGQMSALALEIAGLALFGADLTGDAGQVGRAMTAGSGWRSWPPSCPSGGDRGSTRLVAARRAGGRAREASRDLLQVLLEARDEDGRPLTDAEIGDEVATFLLAGHRRRASVGTV